MSIFYFFREFKDMDTGVDEYIHLITSRKLDALLGREYAIAVLNNPDAPDLLKRNAGYFTEAVKQLTIVECETPPDEHSEKAICLNKEGRRLDLKIR